MSVFTHAYAFNANAQIMDSVTQSVKSRRTRKAEVARSPGRRAAIALSPPLSSSQRTRAALQDAMMQAAQLIAKDGRSPNPHATDGDDVEILRSAHQSSSSSASGSQSRRPFGALPALPTTPSGANLHRRKRSKALGHALRKSRDLRNAKIDIADPQERPLPSLPATGSSKKTSFVLPDESPLVPQVPSASAAPARPSRSLARSLANGKNAANDTSVASTDDDDWSTFIAGGYSAFPVPPPHSIEETMARSRFNMLQQKAYRQARRRSTLASAQKPPVSPLTLTDGTRRTRLTGVDWLDDELAWASDDESSNIKSTPPLSVGLGLTRTATTPPSSSVDTFVGQGEESEQLTSPLLSRKEERRCSTWRLSSAANDVFVTPTASPMIEMGRIQPVSNGKKVTDAKKAHAPMIAELADAVSRYAAEAAGYDSAAWTKLEHDSDEQDEQQDTIAAALAVRPTSRFFGSDGRRTEIANRHDSISSAASSAVSRDFSVTESVSTRPSSMGCASECDGSTFAVSPTRKMRTLPGLPQEQSTAMSTYALTASPSQRCISIAIGAAPNDAVSLSPRSTLANGTRMGHARQTSDTNSSTHSRSSRRKRSSAARIAWPEENAGAPVTPVRTASLQNAQQQQQKQQQRAGPGSPSRALLGSWMEERDSRMVPVPIIDQRRATAPDAPVLQPVPRRTGNGLMSSASHSDLLSAHGSDEQLKTKESVNGSKSGLRSLFSRQRHQSVCAEQRDGHLHPAPADVKAAHTSPLRAAMDRSRSSINLADRIMAKMGGGPVELTLPSRPMADVPMTPASGDLSAPDSPSQTIFGSASLAACPGSALHSAMAARCSAQTAEELRAFAEASSAARRTSTIAIHGAPSSVSTSSVSRQGRSGFSGSLSRAVSLRSRSRGLLFDYDPASPLYGYDDPSQQQQQQQPQDVRQRKSTDMLRGVPAVPNRKSTDMLRTPVTAEKRKGDSETAKTISPAAAAAASRRAALLGLSNDLPRASVDVRQQQRSRPAKQAAAPPVAFWRRNGGRVVSLCETSGDADGQSSIFAASIATAPVPVAKSPMDDNEATIRPVMRRKNSLTLWR